MRLGYFFGRGARCQNCVGGEEEEMGVRKLFLCGWVRQGGDGRGGKGGGLLPVLSV
jgi:hypothetical protein